MPTERRDLCDFKSGLLVNGKALAGDVARVALFDDFLGDVIADQWSAAKGTDPQAVIATIQMAASGTVRLTSGDTTVVAESCSSLTHGLNWKAANGGLVFEAKVTPVSAVTTVQYFVGLTDTLATTTLEQPFTLSGTTFTAVADDAVGFVFDTDATTDVWYAIGVKATTKTAAITCAAPTADTAQTFRIEIDTSGTATFYVDGVSVGSKADAVTTSVALTPVVEVMARTTTSRSIDVDYIYCGQTR